jgi:thioesterase DpgC
VMTLPARKEGIIPGFADLRLPRFVGDRIARRAIQSELRLECESPEGRMICDEIAPPEEMDEAAEAAARRFLGSGAFGAIANRRALRIGQEPLDQFRRYAAYYAKAQAECHFSPQLIVNLERFWDARNRRV